MGNGKHTAPDMTTDDGESLAPLGSDYAEVVPGGAPSQQVLDMTKRVLSVIEGAPKPAATVRKLARETVERMSEAEARTTLVAALEALTVLAFRLKGAN